LIVKLHWGLCWRKGAVAPEGTVWRVQTLPAGTSAGFGSVRPHPVHAHVHETLTFRPTSILARLKLSWPRAI